MKSTIVAVVAGLLSSAFLVFATPASAGTSFFGFNSPAAQVTTAVAFDESRPVRSLPLVARFPHPPFTREIRPENDLGPFVRLSTIMNDPVVQSFAGGERANSPILTFEGLKDLDNPGGGGIIPPDPNGAVGPHNYVETVNVVFAVYDRTGHKLAGPTTLGSLWNGFKISDCTDNSGDPVVLYDRRDDRWLIGQLTSRGPTIFYNCVAISKTSDPAGAYYRYAFSAGPNFPDYPKYSVWSDSFILTSRDFGNAGGYGISVYGLEKAKMVAGDPNAHSMHFFLDSTKVPIYTVGDGLLPADVDGTVYPKDGGPAPIIGTMNTLGPYGAPFDGLNIYDLVVHWSTLKGSLKLVNQLHVASFNSTFPCGGGRACIPEKGTSAKIDFLGYRQRPTFRLAFRKFPTYETMVTNQSVQARSNIAGVRWYEVRRTAGVYTLFQQGTYSPSDGVDRWMGSVAMDKKGNIAAGYSVSNASIFPGIRYAGRRAGAPLGKFNLAEQVLFAGSGSQTDSANRWGDYTSLNLDPVDDCTFWYVNEYYATTTPDNWTTRIGSFKLPGCT